MAAVSYAGDRLDGHPAPARTQRSAGVILGVVAALMVVLGVAVAQVRARPGLVMDVMCFGAIVAGVFLTFGSGAGLVAGGIAGLVVKDFGG